jgi:predicted RNase H-like nuclease (RuvC/YqgF family)
MPSPQEEIKRLKEELEGTKQTIDELNRKLKDVKAETERVRERMSAKRAENENKLREEYALKENNNRVKIDLLTAENEELTNSIKSLDSILEQLIAIGKTNEEHQEGIDFLSSTKLRDLVPNNIANNILQKHSQRKSENHE